MIYYIAKERDTDRQAGSKARNDVYTLCERREWKSLLYPDVQQGNSKTALWRVKRNLKVAVFWARQLFTMKREDAVFYQHPVQYGTKAASPFIKLMKKKGIHFLVLIHDLDSLRYNLIYADNIKSNVNYEDSGFLKLFDAVICHNESMKVQLADQGISPERIICLELFDYLVSDDRKPSAGRQDALIIAGNLDPQKCGYVYDLEEIPLPCPVNLYGIHFEPASKPKTKLRYQGSFEPDELPAILEGKYGIVWDGSSAYTCRGTAGEYLRWNNPHKLSLYLAAGVPVITWKEAAVAAFVEKNGIGITVDSLKELPEKLKSITDDQYAAMRRQAEQFHPLLTAGFYFNRAVDTAWNLFEEDRKR